MNLVDLETFVRVAEAGSITGAAALLSLPKSTVSRRVARLEDAVGVSLLKRSGRTIGLTDEGTSLYRRCAHALHEIVEVGKTLSETRGEVGGLLRLTAPHDLGSSDAFACLLGTFRRRYPEVSIELDLSARRVDLMEEGFDAALRVHTKPLPDSSSLRIKRIESLSSRIYASPAYLAAHGIPQAPSELTKHACVALSSASGSVRWPLRMKDEEYVAEGRPALLISDFTAALTMILAGAGVGALPTFIASAHVADGRLVTVLPEWDLGQGMLSLVWPLSRHTSPKLRAFIDFIKERAKTGSLFGESQA